MTAAKCRDKNDNHNRVIVNKVDDMLVRIER